MVGKTLVRLVLVVPLLAAGLVLCATQRASAAEICGDNGTPEVIGGTVKTDVLVPAGTTCQIRNGVVRGGVTVGPGATFTTFESEIRGSINGTGIFDLEIVDSVVRGSLTVAGGNNVLIAAFGAHPEIRGDVRISGLTSSAAMDGARVRGNVVLDNIPEIEVLGNTIGANLACTNIGEVDPISRGNTVGGTATGQCAGLAP